MKFATVTPTVKYLELTGLRLILVQLTPLDTNYDFSKISRGTITQ